MRALAEMYPTHPAERGTIPTDGRIESFLDVLPPRTKMGLHNVTAYLYSFEEELRDIDFSLVSGNVVNDNGQEQIDVQIVLRNGKDAVTNQQHTNRINSLLDSYINNQQPPKRFKITSILPFLNRKKQISDTAPRVIASDIASDYEVPLRVKTTLESDFIKEDDRHLEDVVLWDHTDFRKAKVPAILRPENRPYLLAGAGILSAVASVGIAYSLAESAPIEQQVLPPPPAALEAPAPDFPKPDIVLSRQQHPTLISIEPRPTAMPVTEKANMQADITLARNPAAIDQKPQETATISAPAREHAAEERVVASEPKATIVFERSQSEQPVLRLITEQKTVVNDFVISPNSSIWEQSKIELKRLWGYEPTDEATQLFAMEVAKENGVSEDEWGIAGYNFVAENIPTGTSLRTGNNASLFALQNASNPHFFKKAA
jgi:hypothetical protein